jgi:transposase-like protein
MPQRFQRPYPLEFRREAVRLVQATRRRYQDVAVELGISGESLRKWLKQEQLDQGERADGLTAASGRSCGGCVVRCGIWRRSGRS